MAEHIGEWHTLTVNDPASTDDVMELEHLASCPIIPAAEDGFHGKSYACSLAEEIGDCGFENFKGPDGGPLTPGKYQARNRAWSDYSYSARYSRRCCQGTCPLAAPSGVPGPRAVSTDISTGRGSLVPWAGAICPDYRALLVTWWQLRESTPYSYGTEEWDSCVEVERHESADHTTEK